MRQRRRCATKDMRDSQGRPCHSRRCFLRRVALSERRRAEPPVNKVDLVCEKDMPLTEEARCDSGGVAQRKMCTIEETCISPPCVYLAAL